MAEEFASARSSAYLARCEISNFRFAIADKGEDRVLPYFPCPAEAVSRNLRARRKF